MTMLEERVAWLEGINEEIRNRLNDMNSRMGDMNSRITSLESRINTQMTVMVAMWVTTMLTVLSTLVAVLLRT